MTNPTISKDHYDCLTQRMRWMEIRSEGKDQIGWDSNYDKRERDALAAALSVLKPADDPGHPPVPEGWRLIDKEKDYPKRADDKFWNRTSGTWAAVAYDLEFEPTDTYIRRIEPTYRPFASAEEFDPHADHIVVNIGTGTRRRIDHWSDKGCMGMSWDMAFRKYTFLAGSPFGVEVKE